MPVQKRLKLGDLKKYAAIALAAVSLIGTPAKLHAQNNAKPKTENFNLKKASERDRALYGAIVNVLELKYDEQDATAKAGQIMSKTAEFSEEQTNNYIRFMVEKFMGDEYKEIMEQTKQKVDGQAVAPTQEKSEQDQENLNEITENKFGREEKTVVENENGKSTTIQEEKTFRMADLTPLERADFNKLVNKIKVAYKLRGKASPSIIDAQAQNNAITIFMSSSREKLFEMAVRGVKFRDIDEQSFVAYYPQKGEGKIHAPADKESQIKKQIKKAGGIENFVMETQPQKVNKGKTGIPLISLDANVH